MTVPGLTGLHRWNNEVSLNDLGSWPRVRLTSIPGLHTLPDLEDQRDTPAGRSGEIPRRAMDRGKQVVYSGVLEASSLGELEELRAQLLGLFMTRDSRMVITRTVGDPEENYAHFFDARVTACDIPEEMPDPSALRRETYGHERNFTLGLRLADPRFYRDPADSIDTGLITPESGTPLPWTLPVVLTPGGSNGATMSVDYKGNAPTSRAVFDLWGPVTSPGLKSETLNRQLVFNTVIPSGSFLRVDFYTRTLSWNGIEEVSFLNRDVSTWWTGDMPALAPNQINVIRYTGTGLADPARASLTYNTADWG